MATLFVDQLTVIDCSVLDPDAGLVGESWIVDIELTGPLDGQGMVLDFSAVKKQIKHAIDALVDHRLLVPLRHAGLHVAEKGERLELSFRDNAGQLWQHGSPLFAVCGIPVKAITPDTLAPWLQQQVQARLAAGMQLQLRLRAEPIDGAHYRYSHGLQQHDGACQRIAHGHRSRIEIEIDGQRSTEWEQRWAGRFHDIYLVTRSHIVGESQEGDTAMLDLHYRSREGEYSLRLPKARCHLFDGESTVEQIAAYLARQTQQELGRGSVRVRAFEGVQKGALAQA
ncbi:MAG: 6-pyruvoyl trahydropterin synthase family protein [Pseudomonadota bacterium]